MPFAVRIGFVILAHLFVLVKYFFKLFFEALSNFLSRTRPCCFVSFAATLIFYQSLSGLSSTFFIFLIPSPDRLDDSLTGCISQPLLFLRFRRNSWYDNTIARICQQLFSKFLKFFLRNRNFRVYYIYINISFNTYNPSPHISLTFLLYIIIHLSFKPQKNKRHRNITFQTPLAFCLYSNLSVSIPFSLKSLFLFSETLSGFKHTFLRPFSINCSFS